VLKIINCIENDTNGGIYRHSRSFSIIYRATASTGLYRGGRIYKWDPYGLWVWV